MSRYSGYNEDFVQAARLAFQEAADKLASALNDIVAIDDQYFLEGVVDRLLGNREDGSAHSGVSEIRDYREGYKAGRLVSPKRTTKTEGGA